MLLAFESGEPFATGAARYQMTGSHAPTHLTIKIEIRGLQVEAIIDTGAPYLICSPDLAEHLNLQTADALESLDTLIRGTWIKGGLHRLDVTVFAAEGASLSIEATVFVPDPSRNFGTTHPSFIGYVGCLERLRFAIDPHTERFYFGPLP